MKRLLVGVLTFAVFSVLMPRPSVAQAASPFLGEIQVFPYNFCPAGWAQTSGQLLPISTNTALFSLLGTNYGGDGISNFALPNWGPIQTAGGYKLIVCIAMQGVFPSRA